MSLATQRTIAAIDLEQPRLEKYQPERARANHERRVVLVARLHQETRMEIEILNRAELKFQPRSTEQMYPTGEEKFRCRNCQRLNRTNYCHGCTKEEQDWRC